MIECWKSMRKEWIVSFQLINLLKFYQYWIYELFPPLTNQAILGIHDLYVYTLQKCVLIQGKIEKLLPCYLKSVIYLLLDIPIYECAVFRRSINTREGGGIQAVSNHTLYGITRGLGTQTPNTWCQYHQHTKQPGDIHSCQRSKHTINPFIRIHIFIVVSCKTSISINICATDFFEWCTKSYKVSTLFPLKFRVCEPVQHGSL